MKSYPISFVLDCAASDSIYRSAFVPEGGGGGHRMEAPLGVDFSARNALRGEPQPLRKVRKRKVQRRVGLHTVALRSPNVRKGTLKIEDPEGAGFLAWDVWVVAEG